jgi:GTP-binding protein HflX
VEDRLFATLDPLTREVELDEGQTVLLTDTVGFVRKLPHQLVASFRATLEEVLDADLLLHVVDVANPTWEEQRHVVQQVLGELGATERPVLYVFTKMDLLPREQMEPVRERVMNLVPGSVFVSTAEPHGVEPLRRTLLQRVRERRSVLEFRIPVSDGRTLAELYRTGEVLQQRADGDELIVSARVGAETAGRLARFVAA